MHQPLPGGPGRGGRKVRRPMLSRARWPTTAGAGEDQAQERLKLLRTEELAMLEKSEVIVVNKIDQLRINFKEAREQWLESMRQKNDVSLDVLELQKALMDPEPTEIDRIKIRSQMEKFEREYKKLSVQANRDAEKMTRCEIEMSTAERRLQVAQENLQKIQDPPPWVAEMNPADLARERERSEKTIKELTKKGMVDRVKNKVKIS